MRFFRNLFLILLILVFAISVSFFINASSLQQLNSPAKVITQENVNDILNEIDHGDIVEITGTIDLLRLASDSNINPENANYFAGLEEFPDMVIIKFRYSKLNFEVQNFRGQVVRLEDEPLATEIISKLNGKIDFNNPLNSTIAEQFSETTKQEIIDSSEGNFDNDSILILDEVLIDQNTIYTNIVLIFTAVSLFLLTLFRSKIFRIKRKKLMVGQVAIEAPNV